MGLLDRLEQSIERILEGTTGSLFRQKLQPVEIGKRLERTMLSHQQVSVNAKLVPNAYEVRLNPDDYQQFAGFKDGLSRQLESALADTASRHHLTALGRLQVTFVEDETVGARNPEIFAEMTDQSYRRGQGNSRRSRGPRHQGGQRRPIVPARAAEQTGVIDVPTGASAVSDGPMLVAEGGSLAGQVFGIPEGNSTLGRSGDNTIVLDAPDVSRRHARLERNGSFLRIYDLNSTNGTWINGEAVHISDIQPGDAIRLGSQELRVDTGSADERARQRWW